ncbi:MAG: O-antigen ligase family protein, partial [Planctomycetota bacterium]
FATTLPFLFGGLLLAWVLLQIVPLPGGMLAAISPETGRILARGGAAPGESHAISILPHDTIIAALRVASALSVFLAAFVLIRSRKALLRVVVPAVGAASILAFLGILKAAVSMAKGSPSLAGLFPQGGSGARASGPFINANQFAGYMEILFPLGVALLLWTVSTHRREGESLRAMIGRFSGPGARVVLVGLAVLLMAGAVLVSQSRTGILGFAVGGCFLALFLVRKLGTKWRAVAAGTAVVLAFCLYLGVDPVLDRYALLMEDREVDRVKAWEMGGEIAKDFPVAGTGLGTFRRVSPLYQPPDLRGGYFQTHNDYVNMASDMGFPGLALVLGILAAWGAVTWRGLSRPGRVRPIFSAAALAAAGAMAVHSFADFNLQVSAIAFHMALVAGVGMAAAGLPESRHTSPPPSSEEGGEAA